jgi:tetratricopeptide (TPR) repeat protein
MTTDDADRRLESLSRKAKDRADALLELELDPTRELLEKSALTGATASAWASASAGLALAWEGRALLDDRLERIRDLRGTRSRLNEERLAELEELLDGRTLPTPGEPGARCSPGELLTGGAAAVEEGRELLRTVAQRWDALVPRLTTASATLRACSELLGELGARPDEGLEDARRELGRLTDAVATDPLAATPDPVAELEAKVAEARGRVERLRDFRADADRRLDEARALLDEAHDAFEHARDAHEAAVTKIAGADPPAPASSPGLEDELDRAVALADAGAWQEAGESLEGWRARATRACDEARRVAAANREPIARRDELRRRLGAYQVKARYLRLLEDRELSNAYTRAHEVLYTAPTDLDEAADLVRRYQEGLSAAGPDREVFR